MGVTLQSKAGQRAGGCLPRQAILDFCREGGITRSDGEASLAKLEHHIRAELDAHSPRCLAVLRPLRLLLTNLPPDHFQEFPAKVGPLPPHTPLTQKLDGSWVHVPRVS